MNSAHMQPSLAILAFILSCTILYTPNIVNVVAAQAPSLAPTPLLTPTLPPTPAGPDCTDALLNLSSCLSYVEAGSKQKVPDSGCCSSFGYLVDNTPHCLCYLLAGAAENYGIKIDNAKALKLPDVCNVVTPPVSLCAEIGIPVPNIYGPSPAPSPSSGGSSLNGGSAPSSSSSPNAESSSPGFRGSDVLQFAALACTLAITAIY